MKQITEKQYRQELEKAKKESQSRKYLNDIKVERDKYKKKFHIETSKLLAVYLFALLNAIVIYAMVSMWKFADLSYLGVLITDIAAQILIYAIYCLKAYKAKKSEEDLKFQREKNSLDELLKAGADSGEYVPTTAGNVETFVTNTPDDYDGSVG